jgi:hypothetical protein
MLVLLTGAVAVACTVWFARLAGPIKDPETNNARNPQNATIANTAIRSHSIQRNCENRSNSIKPAAATRPKSGKPIGPQNKATLVIDGNCISNP